MVKNILKKERKVKSFFLIDFVIRVTFSPKIIKYDDIMESNTSFAKENATAVIFGRTLAEILTIHINIYKNSALRLIFV